MLSLRASLTAIVNGEEVKTSGVRDEMTCDEAIQAGCDRLELRQLPVFDAFHVTRNGRRQIKLLDEIMMFDNKYEFIATQTG